MIIEMFETRGKYKLRLMGTNKREVLTGKKAYENRGNAQRAAKRIFKEGLEGFKIKYSYK